MAITSTGKRRSTTAQWLLAAHFVFLAYPASGQNEDENSGKLRESRQCALSILKSVVSPIDLAAYDSLRDALDFAGRFEPFDAFEIGKLREDLISALGPGVFHASSYGYSQLGREQAVQLLKLSADDWKAVFESRTYTASKTITFTPPPSFLPTLGPSLHQEILRKWQENLRIASLLSTLRWADNLKRALAVQNSGALTTEFYDGLRDFILDHGTGDISTSTTVQIAKHLPVGRRDEVLLRFLQNQKKLKTEREYHEVVLYFTVALLGTSADWLEARIWSEASATELHFVASLVKQPHTREDQRNGLWHLVSEIVATDPAFNQGVVPRPLTAFLEELFERITGKFDVLKRPDGELAHLIDLGSVVDFDANPIVGLIKGIGLLLEIEVREKRLSPNFADKYVQELESIGHQIAGTKAVNTQDLNATFIRTVLLTAAEQQENAALSPSVYARMLLMKEVAEECISEAARLRELLKAFKNRG